MVKNAAPPSRAPRPRRAPVDVRGWLGGIRLSGFMVIMLGLVVMAAFVLVPTVGMYVDQRQRVAAMQHAVQVSSEEVAQLEAQRDRFDDPAYITTQARERLYYVRPGEVLYLVDNDLPDDLIPREQQTVSEDVEVTRVDWMGQFVRTLTEAGIAQTVTPITIGVPDAPDQETSPTAG
ncbi:septum formation initiator family protein [Microbacterium sp. BWT-B31]|uniref:FtsB family cell division protein n=1 Tax=Microbacterium sp. BWT-B31 TaxID=3232072 RepID=UPI003527189F